MDAQMKKCPMCAEQIPAEVTVCPYCATKLLDIQSESTLGQAAAQPPTSAPASLPPGTQTSQPARKKTVIWIGVAFLLVVCICIVGVLLTRPGAIPSPSTHTPANTSTPSRTRTPIPTSTHSPTLTPMGPYLSGGIACVGTDFGLTCLDVSGWHTYTDENAELSGDNIGDMATCLDGSILIVNNWYNLSVWKAGQWSQIDATSTINAVSCASTEDIWLVYYDSVSHYDGTQWIDYPKEQFSTAEYPSLKDVAIVPNGLVWVSTYDSLASFDGAAWTIYQRGQGFPDKYLSFSTIAVDGEGNPWAIVSDDLYGFDGQNWVRFSIPGTATTDVFFDASGRPWVATANGYTVFERGAWAETRGKGDGLSSNTPRAASMDAAGRIWVATSWGLNVFDGEQWIAYHMHTSGLVDNDLNSVFVLGEGPVLPELLHKVNGAINGRVVKDSLPLADVKIEICVVGLGMFYSGSTPCSNQPFVRSATTNADGRFTISDLPPGRYVVTLKPPGESWKQLTTGLGFSSKRVEVRPGETTFLEDLDMSD